MVVLNSECNSASNDAKFLWGHWPKNFWSHPSHR
ncbi:unnamed protein product, partial [Rotaria magnacalcarata]